MNTFRNLRADEIDCRAYILPSREARILLYKNARCDQNILDETVGPMNWQRHHLRNNANCIVSIWDEKKAEWIEKEDTGTESDTERAKGLASDSFKRACVNWGIGRELYTAPDIRILPNQYESDGKYCLSRFYVSEIEYKDSVISHLSIRNKDTGEEVFHFDSEKPTLESVQKRTEACEKALAELQEDSDLLISEVKRLLDETKTKSTDFLGYFKVSKVEDLTEKQQQKAVTMLRKKLSLAKEGEKILDNEKKR